MTNDLRPKLILALNSGVKDGHLTESEAFAILSILDHYTNHEEADTPGETPR